MPIQIEEHQLELRARVDEVLHYVWDPIGVARAPQARDEYYGYIPAVYGSLIDGKEESEIENLLIEISAGGMGMPETDWLRERARDAANLLSEWRSVIQSRDDYHTK